MFSSFFSLKPEAVIVMVYFPGTTEGRVNNPASFVLMARAPCVETSTKRTLAPGTTAPLGSTTVPVMEPKPAWVKLGPAIKTTRARTTKSLRIQTSSNHSNHELARYYHNP